MHPGERLNSYTHIAGAILACAGLAPLLAKGLASGRDWAVPSVAVFGLACVFLYLASALYHSIEQARAKQLFKRLDHIAIYCLIAASYTPFMLVGLSPAEGAPLLALVWLLAALGSASEIYLSGIAVKVCQLLLYIGMGWLSLVKWDALNATLPPASLALLVNGGIAYTAGIVFYIADKALKLPYAHAIWHLFVLAGSGCHYIAIYHLL
ncbi:MAG: hemolysin III family protein [Cellvibrionaceae bacterium]|nr:hemolysin III family protein [Cellvibrionaceae bacterium]